MLVSDAITEKNIREGNEVNYKKSEGEREKET